MKEYKAVIYQEGMLDSLILGQSKINPVCFSKFLNANDMDTVYQAYDHSGRNHHRNIRFAILYREYIEENTMKDEKYLD